MARQPVDCSRVQHVTPGGLQARLLINRARKRSGLSKSTAQGAPRGDIRTKANGSIAGYHEMKCRLPEHLHSIETQLNALLFRSAFDALPYRLASNGIQQLVTSPR